MMRMRKLSAVFASLVIFVACVFGACGDPASFGGGTASQNTQTFVNMVATIKEPITADMGSAIDAASLLYDILTDSEKLNEQVIESKALLDTYKEKYVSVKAEADKEKEEKKQEGLSEQFIAKVNELPALSKLTPSDREALDEAYSVYEQLNADYKEKDGVVFAYSKLAAADEKVTALEKEAHLREVKEKAEAFIEGVNGLGEITLESVDAIEDLLYDHGEFDEDTLLFEGVAQAKEKLDAAYAEYKTLKNEYDAKEFVSVVGGLAPVEEKVTLASERDILKAEATYADLSDETKTEQSVAAAYQTLLKARARYDELYAADQKIRVQKFIAAAAEVGEDIENVNIDWYDVLFAASSAYGALSSQSQMLPEVEEAFERWNRAQTVFDRLGFKQIPMVDPNLLYSGDTPPHIVIQVHENMFKPLRDFYGVSSNGEISKYAIMWLNVYVDGEYVARGEVNISALGNGGMLLFGSDVVNILKTLSADNPEIKSGASFGFAINFEDRKNEFIPSVRTKVSANKNTYRW